MPSFILAILASGSLLETGLGLPLVKAMVEMHGGRMTLESVVGVGTKTTLCFPASRAIARVRAA